MLHGSPSDHSRALAHVEPGFESRKGWWRVYPDLPGHGRTPGSDRIRSMDDYLDVVLEFADRVFGSSRFALGGISFGAYLALAMARKRGSQLDGLLLSVPQVNHSPLEERRDRAHRPPSIQPPSQRTPELPNYSEDTRWLESLPFREVTIPLYRTATPFRAPALFLFGRQDAPFRYQTYWRMLPYFPRATFAILDGAGHRLWSDRNELACDLFRDWLDRMEAPTLNRNTSG
ncbi:MAG: alpha/beta hydrolase [Thermoplasmata archaeon]|nr:alpha/beta hydrolase [Thermoplasmata archaeon]